MMKSDMSMEEELSLFLREDLFFNSNRDTTRGLEVDEDRIALGSLDIIRAAVCFTLESAIVGRGGVGVEKRITPYCMQWT
jgi:hypothetical protein